MPTYNEEQVALVLEDNTAFAQRCTVVLGTPTINRAVRAMKESEMVSVPEAWQHAKAGYEFVHFMMNQNDTLPENVNMPTKTGENPTDLAEKLFLPAFSNMMVHCHTAKTQMQGYKLHVMIHAPYPEDKANCPMGCMY